MCMRISNSFSPAYAITVQAVYIHHQSDLIHAPLPILISYMYMALNLLSYAYIIIVLAMYIYHHANCCLTSFLVPVSFAYAYICGFKFDTSCLLFIRAIHMCSLFMPSNFCAHSLGVPDDLFTHSNLSLVTAYAYISLFTCCLDMHVPVAPFWSSLHKPQRFRQCLLPLIYMHACPLSHAEFIPMYSFSFFYAWNVSRDGHNDFLLSPCMLLFRHMISSYSCVISFILRIFCYYFVHEL